MAIDDQPWQSRARDLRAQVDADLPGLIEDLRELVRIPSIATAGFPSEPVLAAHDLVVALLRREGVTDIDDLAVEGKTGPVVLATVPGPPGSPTVLFYTHYDVVPAGDESQWSTPPFEAVESEGAVYGRGTADSKGNIVSILGMIRRFGGRPPATLRIVLEGQEEFGSPFDFFPPSRPELFAADAMVIADVGSVRPGVPTLTVGLRGSATVTVHVRTLDADRHSGQYGGAAPDARLALIRALATLHDDAGDVAVEGLRREPWSGTSYSDDEFRARAGIVDGVPILGTGDLGSRLWTGPAITVIALDAPATEAPQNSVASSASAVLNVRVHPLQDADEAATLVAGHLRACRPFGVGLEVGTGDSGNGYLASLDGPGYRSAVEALAAAWGGPVERMATGGSIPLVIALDQAVPTAEKLLFGVTDDEAGIHGPNERLLVDELARGIVAKTLFVEAYAQRRSAPPEERA